MPDGDSSEVQDRFEDVEMKTQETEPSASLQEIPQTPESSNPTANAVSPDRESTPRGRKRKIADVTIAKRGRPVSPPWKKVAVDGPTSFIENGRRKSSRTNAVPLELQAPGKIRATRAGKNRKTETNLRNVQNASSQTVSGAKPTDGRVVKRGPKIDGSAESGPTSASKTKSRSSTNQRARRDSSPNPAQYHTQSSKQPQAHDNVHADSEIKQQHRKWRRRRPSSSITTPGNTTLVIPPFSPTLLSPTLLKPIKSLRLKWRPPPLPVLNPGNLAPARRFTCLKDLLAQESPFEGEEEPILDDMQAKEEAELLLQLENATRPGGLLSDERWAGDELVMQEEPSAGYTHPDYLLKHVLDFQPRLQKEKQHHLGLAKRIAQSAYEEWKRRQPQTEEEKAAETQAQARAIYTATLKELLSKWVTVKKFATNQKMAKAAAEMEAKTKDELKKMLDASTLNLKQRFAQDFNDDDKSREYSGSASGSEDFEESGSEGDPIDETDSTSSSSSRSASVSINGDNDLTQDDLRRKYSVLLHDNGPTPDGSSLVDGSFRSAEQDPSSPDPLGEPTYVGVQELLQLDEVGDGGGGNGARACELAAKTMLSEKSADLVDESTLANLPALEEVDDALLDHTDDEDDDDESEDEDDDDDDDDDDEDDDEDDEEDGESEGEQSDNNSVAESEQDLGLFGFYTQKQQHKLLPDPKTTDQTPSQGDQALAPSEEHPPPDYNRVSNILEQDLELSDATHPHADQMTPGFNSSDEASRQMSPTTTNTAKPSEVDSMTSAEAFDDVDVVGTKGEDESETFKTDVSPLLRGQLRVYQHAGLDWLASMYSSHANGILADEMGLGKTIQTIALLAHLATERHVWGPHLIVVPTSVMLNWEMEFKKFCPGFKVLTYYGTTEERQKKRQGWTDDDRWNVCITSYQLAVKDAASLKRRNWHYMVLDEAHNIKNSRSQRWQTLLSFNTRARLLLTGTPLQNNLTELWSLLFFLEPDQDEQGGFKFSDLATFSRTFNKPVEAILEHGREDLDDEARELVAKLHKVLRPHLLRRLKADVEKQMPKKYEHIVKCRLSKRQRQLYDGYMGLAGTRDSFQSGNYLSIINCLMQLRKVCNHPDLFETRQIVTSYAMPKSVVADFEIKELLVRKRALEDNRENISTSPMLNLWHTNTTTTSRREQSIAALQQLSHAIVRQDARYHGGISSSDYRNIDSSMAHLDFSQRLSRLDELKTQYSLTSNRIHRRPLYSSSLLERLMIYKPLQQVGFVANSSALMDQPVSLPALITTISHQAETMKPLIEKFGCITPAVVAPDMTRHALTPTGMALVQRLHPNFSPLPNTEPDPFHESRTRLSIAFPSKALIQYDCGKLQQLDRLLRTLQSGNHRALIFTQMTKVLDILEQFLNLHGYRYFRLDGATKLEQRQFLTDRFNNDPRIPVFILSSRSGGIGINLTGADTVIFYDSDWNPAMDKQCQDRCHRIGQTRDVHIYRFVSEGTIEANILRKSNQKRLLDNVIIQEGDFTTEYFNRIDPRELLDDDADADAAVDKVFGGGIAHAVVNVKAERMLEQAEDAEDQVALKQAEKEEATYVDDADFADTEMDSARIDAESTAQNSATTKAVDDDVTTASSPAAPAPVPSGGPETVPKDVLMADTESPMRTPRAQDQEQAGMPAEPADEAEDEEEPGSWEEYMVRYMQWELKDMAVKVPGLDRNASKNKNRKKKGGGDAAIRIRR